MEINTFFDKVGNVSMNDGSSVIKALFEFSRAINKMSDDDLIAFYQALTMLEKAQPIDWFKKNNLVTNIIEVRKIVIQAMKTSVRDKQHRQLPVGALRDRFIGAIGFNPFI